MNLHGVETPVNGAHPQTVVKGDAVSRAAAARRRAGGGHSA